MLHTSSAFFVHPWVNHLTAKQKDFVLIIHSRDRGRLRNGARTWETWLHFLVNIHWEGRPTHFNHGLHPITAPAWFKMVHYHLGRKPALLWKPRHSTSLQMISKQLNTWGRLMHIYIFFCAMIISCELYCSGTEFFSIFPRTLRMPFKGAQRSSNPILKPTGIRYHFDYNITLYPLGTRIDELRFSTTYCCIKGAFTLGYTPCATMHWQTDTPACSTSQRSTEKAASKQILQRYWLFVVGCPHWCKYLRCREARWSRLCGWAADAADWGLW